MTIAFHAPLKPADHPAPSGDRRMARSLLAELAALGEAPEPICRLRTFDRDGDLRRQTRLRSIAERAQRGPRRARIDRHDLFFTYHPYHKAPDWFGPEARARGLAYVIAEPSFAPSREGGLWAAGHARARACLAAADVALVMTERDRPCVEAERPGDAPTLLLRPFLDAAAYSIAEDERAAARRALREQLDVDENAVIALAVGMMRPGAKERSYRALARALALSEARPRLALAGDGAARPAIEAQFAELGVEARFFGECDARALRALYAGSDFLAWPALEEAYGMTILEAQAAGLPVVIARSGGAPELVLEDQSALVVEPGDALGFARAIDALATDPPRRAEMGARARSHVRARHDRVCARATLEHALERARARRRSS